VDALEWEPKDHEDRIVPLSHESTQLPVNLQSRTREGHPYVFISPEHSAVTSWAQELPMQVAQQLAGHLHLVTTRKYYLSVRSEDLVSANKLLNRMLVKTNDD